jgi:hypothetical protein
LLSLFATVLTAYMIISCDTPKNTELIKENTDSREIDRLLRDMGVTTVPHLAPPVDFNLLDSDGELMTQYGVRAIDDDGQLKADWDKVSAIEFVADKSRQVHLPLYPDLRKSASLYYVLKNLVLWARSEIFGSAEIN